MTVQAELLTEIEAFLAARRGGPDGMAETTFGRLAVNDGKFVRRLRDGCNMTLATIDRVKAFIKSQHDTPGTPSPDGPQPAANDTTKSKPAPRRSRTPTTQAAQAKALEPQAA